MSSTYKIRVHSVAAAGNQKPSLASGKQAFRRDELPSSGRPPFARDTTMTSACLVWSVVSVVYAAPYLPRDLTIINGQFVSGDGTVEQLRGSNVVVKGPPWLPTVNGTERCMPTKACKTFNEADAEYFKSRGWNLVRLGVIWAGGQPTPEPRLDKDFVERLHAILDLCHQHSIRVILDLHQDAMGTAVCGEGVPMWYSQQHLSWLLGKPVVGVESKLIGKCSVSDFTSWKAHLGDPLYNVLNECCLTVNDPSGGWGSKLDPSVGVQITLAHLGASAGAKPKVWARPCCRVRATRAIPQYDASTRLATWQSRARKGAPRTRSTSGCSRAPWRSIRPPSASNL